MFMTKSGKQPICTYNIRLYHGSSVSFDDPKVDVNRGLCDYGPGFYMTQDFKRAFERALESAETDHTDRAYVMGFDYHDELIPPDSIKVLRFSKDADWLRFVRDNRRGKDTGDYDIAIGPSADGFIDEILDRVDRFEAISFDELSILVTELADNHYGDQYCFRNQALVDKYIRHVNVVKIDTNMPIPAPEVISEYVIGAFSEAHGMSVSDAREFIDRYGGIEYIERCYKSFAHMMAPDMVNTLRRHIEWAGGTCPPIVRTDI